MKLNNSHGNYNVTRKNTNISPSSSFPVLDQSENRPEQKDARRMHINRCTATF